VMRNWGVASRDWEMGEGPRIWSGFRNKDFP
jgi:hypothetical protein